jgi:hypothetical protein
VEEFARRCTLCGISFPDEYRFSRCPLHEEATSRIQAEHDPDWVDRLAFLVIQRRLSEMDAELIPVVDAQVAHDSGQLWIHAWDVIRSGLRNRLRDGDLVKVGVRVFEILDYVESRRRYLVRAFRTEVTDEDITELLRGA